MPQNVQDVLRFATSGSASKNPTDVRIVVKGCQKIWKLLSIKLYPRAFLLDFLSRLPAQTETC